MNEPPKLESVTPIICFECGKDARQIGKGVTCYYGGKAWCEPCWFAFLDCFVVHANNQKPGVKSFLVPTRVGKTVN